MSRGALLSAPHARLPARLLVICLLLSASPSAAAQLAGAPAAHSIGSRGDGPHSRDTLSAHSMAPLRQGVGHWDRRDRLTHAWPGSLVPTDSGPGVWKYVGWGAVIGGALTGGYAAYRTRDCDDCMFTGLFIGGAAGIGAVLGGFIASLVYADRYWSVRR